jgi:hypothetical protein
MLRHTLSMSKVCFTNIGTWLPHPKHYTPEEKVAILRRHLLENEPISKLCDELIEFERFALFLASRCFFVLSLTAPSHALAGNTASYKLIAQGSTPTHRTVTDAEFAQLNIYVGGSLPAGTNLLYFQYLFDLTTFGNTTGYITPLLFEYKSVEAATVYTVVGIGRGFEVKLSSVPQAIPFDIIEGTKVPTSNNFTFGFITAIVNLSGVPVATSQGVVDFDGTYPDGGPGVGGAGTTNDWVWTVGGPPPVVALGTTFGLVNADYTLGIHYRTYSARAIGAVVTQ